jgi:hypothetical protein
VFNIAIASSLALNPMLKYLPNNIAGVILIAAPTTGTAAVPTADPILSTTGAAADKPVPIALVAADPDANTVVNIVVKLLYSAVITAEVAASKPYIVM